MLRWLLYGSIGLLLYLVFLIATVPAHVITGWLPLPKTVALQQPSGTLWQGQARHLQLDSVTLDTVEWQLSPWSLLTGTVSLNTRFGQTGVSDLVGQGRVQYAWGKVSAENLVVELPAQLVLNQSGMRLPFTADGDVRLVVDQFVQGAPWCEQLNGTLDWSGARVTGRLLSEPLVLGLLQSQLSCDQGELVLSMDDSESPLGLKGSVRLQDQMRYQLSTLVRPDASLPNDVREGVTLFAKQTTEGYLLEMDGRL